MEILFWKLILFLIVFVLWVDNRVVCFNKMKVNVIYLVDNMIEVVNVVDVE